MQTGGSWKYDNWALLIESNMTAEWKFALAQGHEISQCLIKWVCLGQYICIPHEPDQDLANRQERSFPQRGEVRAHLQN